MIPFWYILWVFEFMDQNATEHAMLVNTEYWVDG